MFLFAFDLDGTLIHNRQAVVEAYRMAGIDMPYDAWGKPASAWLPEDAAQAHAAKNQFYPKALELYAKPGRALNLFRAVAYHNDVLIVTGASQQGAAAAIKFLGIDIATNHVHTGCSALEKRKIFADMSRVYKHCFFIDSDETQAYLIRGIDNWSFTHI